MASLNSEKYWNQLYSKKKDALEWYVSYDDMHDQLRFAIGDEAVEAKNQQRRDELQQKLHKEASDEAKEAPLAQKDPLSSTPPPPSGKIVVSGCGNSSLAVDLCTHGYTDVYAVDFSSVAIKRQEELAEAANVKGELNTLQHDLRSLPFEVGSVRAFIDKGTLDTAANEASTNAAADMLKEAKRLLCVGGTYVCVSVLNESVLSLLINVFGDGHDMTVRTLTPAMTGGMGMFFVEVRRNEVPRASAPMRFRCYLESSDESVAPIKREFDDNLAEDLLRKFVHEAQWRFQSRLARKETAEGTFMSLSLFAAAADSTAFSRDIPRYIITVLDIDRKYVKQPIRCGVFLVPQGLEHDYRSSNAKLSFAQAIGIERLIMVEFGRGHSFGTMQEVQDELSPKMMELAPADVRKEAEKASIPFLCDANGIGQRTILARGRNDRGIEWFVERLSGRGPIARLRFTMPRGDAVVYAEVREAYVARLEGRADHASLLALALPHHHCVPRVGISERIRVVVLGNAMGLLPYYVSTFAQKTDVTWIAYSRELREASEAHFKPLYDAKQHTDSSLTTLDSVATDTLSTLSRSESAPTHVLIVDVDDGCGESAAETALAAPPRLFVSDEYMDAYVRALSGTGGLLCLQIRYRIGATLDEIRDSVRARFGATFYEWSGGDHEGMAVFYVPVPPTNADASAARDPLDMNDLKNLVDFWWEKRMIDEKSDSGYDDGYDAAKESALNANQVVRERVRAVVTALKLPPKEVKQKHAAAKKKGKK